MGWWSYYVALIGGFNYISKELGVTRPYQTFYTYNPEKNYLHNQEFMDDMNRLANSTDSWIFSLMPASGSQEPTLPTQFHFTYGAEKGDETYDDPNITLNDVKTFDALYQELAKLLEEKYELLSDRHRYHANSAKNYFARHLNTKVNAVAMRIAWSVTCWDMRAIQLAQELASMINKHINHCDNPEVSQLKVKDIGYNGYANK
jgi:voltage-gated potassium channel